MADEAYDIVVVGAGIHGAGIAQAAAAAGYSVLVLERNAVASATSSRSSKLIHGGLRYLESGQFALVRECLHERALLLKLAPELVKLKPFYLPIYRNTLRRPWQIRAGLGLYALLGGLDRAARFAAVPRSGWEKLDGLRLDGLQAVFQYWDAQTDDAALTKSVMHSARILGAQMYCPAEFLGAQLDERCHVQFEEAGQRRECRARVLINAAGPWVNHVLQRVTPAVSALPVEWVQGTHLVIAAPLAQGVYYLEAPADHRAVFVIPWKNKLMVGTTEVTLAALPDSVAPTNEEVAYLLETLRYYFPRFETQAPLVEKQFAGLRVLPASAGAAFHRKRDSVLHLDRTPAPRLITIYGGKLTAYRATAERVIRRFAGALPQRKRRAHTASLELWPVDS
jgi:glycerol-3-phosphate dehydrogenase